MFHINLTEQQYGFMFNVFHKYLYEKNLYILILTRSRVNSDWDELIEQSLRAQDPSCQLSTHILWIISSCYTRQEGIICYIIRKEEIIHNILILIMKMETPSGTIIVDLFLWLLLPTSPILYTPKHTHTHIYTYTHTHTNTNTHIHTKTHIHTHIQLPNTYTNTNSHVLFHTHNHPNIHM